MQLQDTTTRRRVRLTIQPCAYCENDFKPLTSEQKFCSRACADDAKRRDYGRRSTCQHCGNEYRPKKYDRVSFCSRECSLAQQKAAARHEIKERKNRLCHICKTALTGMMQRCCSNTCRLIYRRQRDNKRNAAKKLLVQRSCKECGKAFIPEYRNKHRDYCSYNCSDRLNRRIGRALRRARIRGLVHESIDPIAVFARDGWRCRGCGKQTPRRLRGSTHRYAPELDHIVPIALGGSHTWTNVQCLCRGCNQSKGASDGAQLLMVGLLTD